MNDLPSMIHLENARLKHVKCEFWNHFVVIGEYEGSTLESDAIQLSQISFDPRHGTATCVSQGGIEYTWSIPS
jgi:hypothetical protein